jgi:NAD(P)-dependent dehydrogenase (short-subunit alcohol dehydrogenase family)
LAALKRGDKVIATARSRSLSKLDDLKEKGGDVVELDVTDSLQNLHTVAAKAVAIHGRIDVLVNNAGTCCPLFHASYNCRKSHTFYVGFSVFGALEENTPEETESQFQ